MKPSALTALTARALFAGVMRPVFDSAAALPKVLPEGDVLQWTHAAIDHSTLALRFARLLAYAQRGDGNAPDALCDLHALVRLLGGPLAALREDDTDPEALPGDLGVLARGVLARATLEQGADVPQRWLAALGGVTPQRVRQLVAEGTLHRRRGPRGAPSRDRGLITWESASAWLHAAGVAGV